MKGLLRSFTFAVTFFIVYQCAAQDFSNKGRDFWIAYTGHIDGATSVMGLYLTGDQNASGTVQVGAAILPFTITSGQVTTLFIGPGGAVSNAAVYNGQADAVNAGAGIHVISDRDIVVYAHIIKSARSGATLVLPKSVLGKEYIVPSYRNMGSSASYGEIAVVAVEPATTIEITPTIPDRNNSHGAGIPFTVTLANPGDVYQLQGRGSEDFSGSIVKSISTGSGGCKPIAVFSSTTWSGFDCANASGGDNLYQQLFPTKSWGKKFVTAPFINKPYDIIRVFVQNPSTIVQKTESGITTTLTGFFPAGNYYEFKTNRPTVIQADQPVSVVQYITSQSCGGGNSDPEMTLINPVEQTLDKITLFSAHQNYVPPGQTQVTTHYINVVIPTSKASTFLIDGALPTSGFSVIPNSGYSYLQENVTSSSALNPVHRLQADTGFTAIVYGYGNVESYGYNAGTNVRDLYQFVTIQNQYAAVNFPSTCKSTPFHFAMTFPYQPTQIQWIFGAALNAQGIADTTLNSPNYDSTWVINGKTLYRYPLPRSYIIANVGTYPIKVIAQNPSPDGCNGEQEINYDLEVFGTPTADFNFTASGCISDSVHFFNSPVANGRPTIRWFWNFDDPASAPADASTLENPAHLFMAQGSHSVAFSTVTDVGCLSDTVRKSVIISQPPIAKFGVTAPYCAGKTLTFTDSSSISSGVIVKWTWNFGDGSPVVVATTNVPQVHTYATAGNYTATLQVENGGGCKSLVFPKIITISPNPVPDFTFGSACLPSGTVQFTNTSTIADGTQNAFVYTWNFGDGGTSGVKDPAHNYVSGGPYIVSLLVVSNAGCADSVKKPLTTVYAQPKAQFTVDSIESCFGGTLDFTDQSTAANSTIAQWFWNFGDGQTSTVQNPTHTYAAAGTYTITLYTKSAAGCFSDTATLPVTVYSSPTVSFTSSALKCERVAMQFTSTSVSNGGSITTNAWTVNTAPAGSNNPVLSYTPPSPGNYTVQLTVTTNKGCKASGSQTVTVNPGPIPDFLIPNVCLPAGNALFTNQTTVSTGSTAGFTYNWVFSDGGTSTQTNATHVYTIAGPHTVTLTATSPNGCFKDTVKTVASIYAQPQAKFTAPTETCLGSAVSFTDQSSAANSTITGWQWSFGDGQTSVASSPTHTYAAAGTYTVTLTATSAVGCTSTTYSLPVTINALPIADFIPANAQCVGQALTFTNASVPNSGNIIKWTWNFGDGSPVVVATTGTAQNHSYAATGPYTVTLQVETNKGCISTITSKQVTISPLPVVGFKMPDNCLSDPISTFTDTSSIADGSAAQFTYLWNFGDPNANGTNPNTATIKNGQHKYSAAQSYNVTLSVTSNKGCSASSVQPFSINGAIPTSLFSVQGGLQRCSNDSIKITDNSMVDVGKLVKLEIYWDYTNNPTSKTTITYPVAGANYTHGYTEFFTPATKTVTVRVVAYSGDNCLHTSNQTITLQATPNIVFPAIGSICADKGPFQILAGAPNMTGGSDLFSGTGISPAGLFNPQVAGSGTYLITYTYTGSNGCINAKQQAVTVFPVPTVSAGPDKFVLGGGSAVLNGTSTGSRPSYLWTPATWLNNPAIAQPVSTPADDILYTLKVISADGCSDSDQVFVKVLKAPTIPNVFTPNGDGTNDKWVIQYLESYPGATVDIFNRYGSLVYHSIGYTKPWDGTYNGREAPAGTYYYIINPKNGRKQISGFVDIVR